MHVVLILSMNEAVIRKELLQVVKVITTLYSRGDECRLRCRSTRSSVVEIATYLEYNLGFLFSERAINECIVV